MHIEGKYLLVSYRDIPDIDFICENGGDLRIRVSKVDASEVQVLPEELSEDAASRFVVVFENVSNRVIKERGEFLKAIHWYKSKFGVPGMNLLYL